MCNYVEWRKARTSNTSVESVLIIKVILEEDDIKKIMKHLSRLLVVDEQVLAGVISLHQMLMLLAVMTLRSSGDW